MDGSGARRAASVPLVVGLVNNMPDAALRQAELQWTTLLNGAMPHHEVKLIRFELDGIERSEAARHRVFANSRPASDIGEIPLDLLVVTGMEPGPGPLDGEPYWPSFQRLVDDAVRLGLPAIWSCLAGHAAVQHLSGIARKRLPAKLSGLYDCRKAAEHAILAELPVHWHVPHSRHYSLDGDELAAAGFDILSHGVAIGPDSFVAADALFLFFQGHPEYDRTALPREYLRDVRRWLNGERANYPLPPRLCLTRDAELELLDVQARAAGGGGDRDGMVRDVERCLREGALPALWQAPGRVVVGNWLSQIIRGAALPLMEADRT